MSDRPLNADDIPWQPSEAPAPEPRPRPTTLPAVEAVYQRWMGQSTDPIPRRAVLATYIANKYLEGDPVWLMLVGGSGVGKTEELTPLAAMPDVVLESSISGVAALLSGTSKKDRSRTATGGILRKLPDGHGMLVLKDFTSIIDMHRDSRAEILAAFREIYDGRWHRSVGADGGHTLTWEGHVGIIAGCTTAIDGAHAVISAMGTRFVLVRLTARQDGSDLADSALKHLGAEVTMRGELRHAVRSLLDHPPGTPHRVMPVLENLKALSALVAYARSPVDRDHQGEIRLVLDAEAPTRVAKMLAMLWQAGGLLGLDREAAWAMVHRVGLDSIPKLRRTILDFLSRCVAPQSTSDVAEYVEHPTRTTRRALEDLTAHRVVRRDVGGQGLADKWELSDLAKGWLDRSTLPVLSDLADRSTLPVLSDQVLR